MFSNLCRTSKGYGRAVSVLRRNISLKHPNGALTVQSGEENAPSHGHQVVDPKEIQKAQAKKKHPKYISFKDFPKAPVDQNNNITDLFVLENTTKAATIATSSVASVGTSLPFQQPPLPFSSIMGSSMNTTATNGVPENKEDMLRKVEDKKFHNFNIPKKYLRGYIETETDSMINGINDDTSLIFEDPDLSRPPYSEHPLKRTWSGLMPLNAGLHTISNEYLWELAPENKLFNVQPFGSYKESEVLSSFKTWENSKKEQEKVKILSHFEEQERAREAIKEFEEQTSFYSVSGGRKKLNRNLVKKYKKLRLDGLLGKDDSKKD